MGLIDCHAHFFPPVLINAFRELTATTYFGRNMWADVGFTSLERHL